MILPQTCNIQLLLPFAKFPYEWNKCVAIFSEKKRKNLMTLQRAEVQSWWLRGGSRYLTSCLRASGLGFWLSDDHSGMGRGLSCPLYQTPKVINTYLRDVIQAPPSGRRPQLHLCHKIFTALLSACLGWFPPLQSSVIKDRIVKGCRTLTSNICTQRPPSSSISTLSHTLSCPTMFRATASD